MIAEAGLSALWLAASLSLLQMFLGWAAVRPGFARPPRISQPQAPRDGWEERKSYDYATSPHEKLAIGAYAWRAGKARTGIAIQGSPATSEKRGGPTGLALGSLRP